MKKHDGLVGVVAYRDADGNFGKARPIGSQPGKMTQADKDACDWFARNLVKYHRDEIEDWLSEEEED